MSESTPGTTSMTKSWWASRFSLPDGRPSFSEMWATSEEAIAIAARRGFEPPKKRPAASVKEMRPSKWAQKNGLEHPGVIHSLVYLGFLAARSGVVSAEDLVQDGSALHELGHYLEGVRRCQGRDQADIVVAAMQRLERLTPGVPPADVGMHD